MEVPAMETLRKPFDKADFSSSPAFATPLHPIQPKAAIRPPLAQPAFKPTIATVLPILLQPAVLRPLAFRTFTKKHGLTLSSSALQALASFIGSKCGSGWRSEGTGEKVLEEVAKLWKAETGPDIVEDGDRMKAIFKAIDSCMTGGRIEKPPSLSRQSTFAFNTDNNSGDGSHTVPELARQGSFGMSKLQVAEHDEQFDTSADAREWIKVISAYDQPRLSYDSEKKHFVQNTSKPSMLPSATQRSAMAKERYHMIQQRLLRNEAFQAPSFRSHTATLRRQDSISAQQFYKLTPITNLLGRGGTSHLLLGMLVVAPTGTLALNDMTGSIYLDLQHASSLQGEEGSFFCPGMIVLVDGVYEEDWAGAGSSGLGNTGGVGGMIGGRFVGFSVGGPPVEKRNVSLGINLSAGDQAGGLGWTDFLGQGSERALGTAMRRLEQRLLETNTTSPARQKMIILSDVTLDHPQTLAALRHVLSHYEAASSDAPMTFVLMGNFTSTAAMAGAGTGSIEYKELFNELAAVISDYPTLLRNSTWVFVPGDNDPWNSAFSAGASPLIPRAGVPDIFTNRVIRAFATAKADEANTLTKKDSATKNDGEAVWTTNPSRISLFGPAHEIALFRDDISGRFRRTNIRIGQAATTASSAPNHSEPQASPNTQDTDTDTLMSDAPTPELHPNTKAKQLIQTLLPQSTLSPFPLSHRPTNPSYASSLSLYPLPTTLILADPETPAFALTYEGCHVLNPGPLVIGGWKGAGGSGRGGGGKKVGWAEYDVWSKRGKIMEGWVS